MDHLNFGEHSSVCESECNACPFNVFSEDSANAQNLGCLPTPHEIVNLCIESNMNWSCHEKDGKLCAGYVAICLDNGIEFKGKKMLSTDTYLRTGEIVNVEGKIVPNVLRSCRSNHRR